MSMSSCRCLFNGNKFSLNSGFDGPYHYDDYDDGVFGEIRKLR